MTKHPLEVIFKEQKILDAHIHKNNNITYSKVMNERIVALATELAELANEVRCFKFWSYKKSSPDAVILEAYADGIHFITSLAIALKMKPTDIKVKTAKNNLDRKYLSKRFKHLFGTLNTVDTKPGISKWYSDYLILGQELGFSIEKIIKAYLEKCKINHQRQDNKY